MENENKALAAMYDNRVDEYIGLKNKVIRKDTDGCKYCSLLSGGVSILDEDKDNELRIERHNDTYVITTLTDCCDYNVEINYCPMCGRKLNDEV